MKKLLFYIISIIVLIWCTKLICQERIYLNVNTNNRELISTALKDKAKYPRTIQKVALGQGWHCGELDVYYFFGIREKLHIYEGDRVGNLTSYIRENGYSYDNICIILIVVDIISILLASVYFNRKDEWG